MVQRLENGLPFGDLESIIVRYVEGFDLSSLSPNVVEAARIAFIDTIGVMLAGARSEPAKFAFDVIGEERARPAVTLVGTGLQTSPQLAAFGNAIAAHSMDYDFTYLQGQTVVSLIPALLPVAERHGVTSHELFAAFVIGFELASRIARSAPQLNDPGGWHSVSVIGTIATAVACAKLMRIDSAKIVNVIGISASLAGGLEINFGTMTKPLHAGNAARNGVLAASMAAAGFTAKEKSLEGRYGYFASFARGLVIDGSPFNDLGKRNDLTEIGYKIKAYPCGGHGHTAIDAALELRGSLGSSVSEIESVEVGTTAHAAKLISSKYPSTIESAKFSASYLVAASLLRGVPTIEMFTEETIADNSIRVLASKVSGHIDTEFGHRTDITPARLTVRMSDGRAVEKKLYYASGSPQSPMSKQRIDAKFKDCAASAVSADRAELILCAIEQIGINPSLVELWPLLRTSA